MSAFETASSMSRRTHQWWLVAIVLPLAVAVILAHPAPSATYLGAPSAFVDRPQNVVARLAVLEKINGDKVRFKRVARLHGDAKRRETLRVSDEAYATLMVGETYVIAFTRLRRPPRTHGVYERDFEGPRVLEAPAVGPIVFADAEAMHRLVLRPKGDVLASARLEDILDSIVAEDLPSARFAAAELIFGDQLRAAIGPAQIQRLAIAIDRAARDSQLQDLLLRSAIPIAAEGGQWLAAASKRVLSSHSIEVDFSSFVPSLLQSAAKALAASGAVDDSQALAVHLRSRHPGVAKAALVAMRQLDEIGARRSAREALEAPGLPTENRRVLERYLRQVESGA